LGVWAGAGRGLFVAISVLTFFVFYD